MRQHVFIVSKRFRIREADVSIEVCKKRTWAEELNGKRHLLGSTAFFTMAAAERCKLAQLDKLLTTQSLRFVAPKVVHGAQRQLDLFKHKGVFH